MKILIIRHGDPNYELDTLTEKGWKEAEKLAERIAPMNVKAYYASPMGRAQDTASVTMKKAVREVETLPWLHEFDVVIDDKKRGKKYQPWDLVPEEWTGEPAYYDKGQWFTTELMENSDIEERFEAVKEGLDALLLKHGYERVKQGFKVVNANDDTIVFFCHFGVQCVILACLLGISPIILLNGLSAEPTAVTTVITEDRFDGVTAFRISGFGDISHLDK
ncbi:MAG: histidine phosphatase family protein [Lachnospiraceae bacterium]|nr:histidine phosphatase family protein [Lachnospiraceae bacterium]